MTEGNDDRTRVVVTGLGAITSQGGSLREFWESVREGRVAIRDVQHIPMDGFRTRIAGEVQVAVVPLATARPLVEGGQLRALGVTGARRAAALPNVPTIAETIPGFESSSWQGWFVAAKTPRDTVEFIQRETAKVLPCSARTDLNSSRAAMRK